MGLHPTDGGGQPNVIPVRQNRFKIRFPAVDKYDLDVIPGNSRPADQILHEAYLGGAPWNESYWNNADFDATLASARRELDFNKRKSLYVAAQKQLFEEGGTLVPYHVNKLVGTTAQVNNLDEVINDAVRWHLVTVD